jgi:probable rRNA maturation factor
MIPSGPPQRPLTAGQDEHAGPSPRLSLHDHSERHPASEQTLSQLAETLQRALPLVWQAPGSSVTVLPGLEEVEITLLDDAVLTSVHGDFLDDPTPTDVITFHHGEILVSVETATREAAVRGGPVVREIALYIIHGLLHLHGHTDAEPAARAAMHAAQDLILETVWPADTAAAAPQPESSATPPLP